LLVEIHEPGIQPVAAAAAEAEAVAQAGNVDDRRVQHVLLSTAGSIASRGPCCCSSSRWCGTFRGMSMHGSAAQQVAVQESTVQAVVHGICS
jgi:hypothetical protein